MSRITGGLVAAAVVLGIMVATPGFVSAASINVSPNTVAPGDNVRLTGDILLDGTPGCDVTGTVILVSEAFPGDGFLNLPLDPTGHFDSTVTLSASVVAGTYSIAGRCGGGNIGAGATIVVRALPPTGLRLAVKLWIAVASTLVAIGLTLLAITRPRRVRST